MRDRLNGLERMNESMIVAREREIEDYDRLYELRLKHGRFAGILETADGHACYIDDTVFDALVTPRPPGVPREVYFAVRLPRQNGISESPEPINRTIRAYRETDRRIKGIPVFSEVVFPE